MGTVVDGRVHPVHPFHGARLIEVEQPKDQPRGSGVVSSPTSRSGRAR
ncbi:hypothetical protein I553_0070 [Mycobacterium xenopi 4042]|uniref:Uncharacterized protein n=1 Tax=Mycobacterium xenopi 4042 TaxID=1299334 RepID=X8BJ48_MYCXE|nr:hypothetical protein I553_0070 [Mycobacterium xenopi 4042]